MINLVMFSSLNDLEELTGLTHDELWEKGLNLDDLDIGFQSPVKLHTGGHDGYFTVDYDSDIYEDARWLIFSMNNYCAGPNYVELNGKHYYTVHHS